MRGAKRIAEDICAEVERENLEAVLSTIPEKPSFETIRSALNMGMACMSHEPLPLSVQIERHRQGGSE